MRAGIEIDLGPGWKTYWRYPGDSGLPPRFDFSRSENVDNVEVLWPVPHAFSDESGHSIGYKNNVILPLHVTAREPGKPSVLRLDLNYAVCERYCAPVEAKAELTLPGRADNRALAASEARVPKPAALGQAGSLAITAIRREAGARSRVFVDVTASAGAAVELFAEGPTPDWALPVPEPVTGAPPGVQRFVFDIDGVPPGASAQGATIRLTAATADAAIEVTARLD
jgi:DsbC/DsbD-like thiol-disulfide interchange protein